MTTQFLRTFHRQDVGLLTVNETKHIGRSEKMYNQMYQWNGHSSPVSNMFPPSFVCVPGCRVGGWTPTCTAQRMTSNTDYCGGKSTLSRRRVRASHSFCYRLEKDILQQSMLDFGSGPDLFSTFSLLHAIVMRMHTDTHIWRPGSAPELPEDIISANRAVHHYGYMCHWSPKGINSFNVADYIMFLLYSGRLWGFSLERSTLE